MATAHDVPAQPEGSVVGHGERAVKAWLPVRPVPASRPRVTRWATFYQKPYQAFRDWCAEATNTPREVAETALGHVSGGAVERAYRRTDFLEQRRALMEQWASHCIGAANVIAIGA